MALVVDDHRSRPAPAQKGHAARKWRRYIPPPQWLERSIRGRTPGLPTLKLVYPTRRAIGPQLEHEPSGADLEAFSDLPVLVEVIDRFLHPQAPTHLWALLLAGVGGVVGNEVAAIIRWRAGKRLDSPALIADGIHARADGYVSAGIMVSAAFVAIGLPIADPIIGLVITGLIVHSTWESWLTIRRA